MTDPMTLTAGAIATLAFQEFIKAGAGEVAKKFTSEAIAKMDELHQKIVAHNAKLWLDTSVYVQTVQGADAILEQVRRQSLVMIEISKNGECD